MKKSLNQFEINEEDLEGNNGPDLADLKTIMKICE